MCGRFKLVASGRDVAERFNLGSFPDLAPRYNVAPGQAIAVVRQTAAGRECAPLRWGLVPSWAKDPSVGYRMLNARAETIAEKPAFRAAFRKRRCLVPADGFYEWQRNGRTKQPILFSQRDELFAFAGLWECWKSSEGVALETCTIVTTEANDLLRPIHDRMPVILAIEDYSLWLDSRPLDAEEMQHVFRPSTAVILSATLVNSWVNDARHEGPLCVEPAGQRSLF